MSTSTMTTARAAAEHLSREIRLRDLADLMPRAVYTRTKMPLLIEQACSTILDTRAPDELVCGCALEFIDLIDSFDSDGMLFELERDESASRMLRKRQIRAALRAAQQALEQVRGGLA